MILGNIGRVTLQALAAILGGAQSLHTNGFDEALALPSQEAEEVALQTQEMLREEAGLSNVIDPLGGAFYVEALTKEISDRCTRLIVGIQTTRGYDACYRERMGETGNSDFERLNTRLTWTGMKRTGLANATIKYLLEMNSETRDHDAIAALQQEGFRSQES